MTTEERFARMEHILHGHMEQAKTDYEENRRLWRDLRDNQEQSRKDWADAFAESRRRSEEEWSHWREEQTELQRQSRAEADVRGKALDERIGKLVSSIGELIQRMDGGRAA